MSQTFKETIVIGDLGKWGPKVNGTFYSYSKNFKDQVKVVPGANLEVEIWQSDSGKNYINKIVAVVPSAPVSAPVATPAAEPKAKKANPYKAGVAAGSGRDFDAEARGKTRCALFMAAIQSPAVAALTTPEEISKLAIELSNIGFDYVFEGR